MAKLKPLKAAERVDAETALRLAEWRGNPLVRLLAALAQIADQQPAFGASALMLALGLAKRDRRLTDAAIRLAAAIRVTTTLKMAVERSVSRTRPNAVLGGRRYERKRGGSKRRELQAFPSGHTAAAVAAARVLARAYPEHAAAIWTAAALIAFIQLPSGAHYPGEVGAGALIGVVGEAAADKAVTFVAERVRASPPAAAPTDQPERRPGRFAFFAPHAHSR